MMDLATSSTLAIRLSGTLAAARFLNCWYSSSDMPVYRYKLVSIVHGATALTRIPKGASSNALHFVSISRPALVMQQPIVPALGRLPAVQETLTMQPLESSRYLWKIKVIWKAQRRFMSIKQSKSWGKVLSTSPSNIRPILISEFFKKMYYQRS